MGAVFDYDYARCSSVLEWKGQGSLDIVIREEVPAELYRLKPVCGKELPAPFHLQGWFPVAVT